MTTLFLILASLAILAVATMITPMYIPYKSLIRPFFIKITLKKPYSHIPLILHLSWIALISLVFQSVYLFLTLVFIFAVCLALVAYIYKKDIPVFLGYMLAALLFMAIFQYFLIAQTGSPFLGGGDDEFFWGNMGRLSQALTTQEVFPLVYYEYIGFTFPMALIRAFATWFSSVSEREMFIGVHVLNVAFSGLILVAGRHISRLLFEPTITRIFTIIYTISPWFYFYSTILLRDTIAALYFMVSIALYLDKDRGKKRWIVLLPFLIISLFTRPNSAMVLLVLIVGFSLLFKFRHRSRLVIGLGFGAVGTVLIAVAIMLQLNIGVQTLGFNFRTMTEVRAAHAVSSAGAGSLGAKLVSLPMAVRLFVAPPYYLLTPFPPVSFSTIVNSNYSPDSFIPAIAAIFWLFLLPAFVYGVIHLLKGKNKYQHFLVVIVGLLLILISVTSLEPRHRCQITPLLFLFAAVGIHQIIKEKKTFQKQSILYAAMLFTVAPMYMYSYLKFILLPLIKR